MSDNVFTFPGKKAQEPKPVSRIVPRERNLIFTIQDLYTISLTTTNRLTITYLTDESIPLEYRNTVAVNRVVLPWEEVMILSLFENYKEMEALRHQNVSLQMQLGKVLEVGKDASEPPEKNPVVTPTTRHEFEVDLHQTKADGWDMLKYNIIWTFNAICSRILHNAVSLHFKSRDFNNVFTINGDSYIYSIEDVEKLSVSHAIVDDGKKLALFFVNGLGPEPITTKNVTYEISEHYRDRRHELEDSRNFSGADENSINPEQWALDVCQFFQSGRTPANAV
jgi:hypothetical protein